MQQIGVFGASFNPPTLGHRDVIIQALPFFDEILLVPSLSHAFQKTLLPIHHRLAMLNLFMAEWQNNKTKVKICNIEEDIQREQEKKGPIYTIDVLTMLTHRYGSDGQIKFILGPDIGQPAVWQKFHRYKDIEKNWQLFEVKQRLPIHSTMVREACKRFLNDPVSRKEALIKLTGKSIANYIEEHRLYQEKTGTYG